VLASRRPGYRSGTLRLAKLPGDLRLSDQMEALHQKQTQMPHRSNGEMGTERLTPGARFRLGTVRAAVSYSTTLSLRLGFVLLACLLLATACRDSGATVLGKAPKGQPRSILSVRAGDTPPQVTISGVMIEKCPVAGCWFRLRDSSGTIKVDTKSAGFVVVDVPLQRQVTVAGKVVAEGSDVILEATGLCY